LHIRFEKEVIFSLILLCTLDETRPHFTWRMIFSSFMSTVLLSSRSSFFSNWRSPSMFFSHPSTLEPSTLYWHLCLPSYRTRYNRTCDSRFPVWSDWHCDDIAEGACKPSRFVAPVNRTSPILSFAMWSCAYNCSERWSHTNLFERPVFKSWSESPWNTTSPPTSLTFPTPSCDQREPRPWRVCRVSISTRPVTFRTDFRSSYRNALHPPFSRFRKHWTLTKDAKSYIHSTKLCMELGFYFHFRFC
jgi:hypothetical protein